MISGFVDAHAHLDDPRIADPLALLERAAARGVDHVVCAGFSAQRATHQMRIRHPNLAHAIGIHPWAVDRGEPACQRVEAAELGAEAQASMEALLAMHRPVAIGEIGLDKSPKFQRHLEHQIAVTESLVGLATRHGLPVIFHCVRAHEELLALTRPHTELRAMIHGFTGSPELARRYLDRGFLVSIGGAATDPSRHKLHRTVAAIPSDRLLIETDSPDQTPLARRPSLNEPAFLIDIAKAVAAIREETVERVRATTSANAARLFGLRRAMP